MDKSLEPIAICGMALRLPGALRTPAEFWSLLTEKKDARARIPLQRFNAEAFHSASGKSGYINSKYGYFLDENAEVGAVDTSFFRMSQQESYRMDPQQKMLLELARECFESAGEIQWRGKDIGTYIGSFGNDWVEMIAKDPMTKSMYNATGQGDFMLSNRLAYEYDLKGPSITMRTACSASLTGLHEACVAVRSGDCSAALVGGCSLLWSPDTMSDMSEQGVLSLHSSCRTFDASADGYARGEAVNMIYIKPLSAAIKDGNCIRAVIRGTAINSDGKTAGTSLPSSLSQEDLIRKAYDNAGITGSDITQTAFVECHGTGTPTGDPIEAAAVANVFGNSGVYIGSCKPNVGHSEGASGITSIIKAVLSLENQIIPPNIKFDTPNPEIPFAEKDLNVPVDCIKWPKNKLERVSVNSFGVGGANAHVILESFLEYTKPQGELCTNISNKSIDANSLGHHFDEFTEVISLERKGVSAEHDLAASLESGKLLLVTANTSKSLQTQIQNFRDYGLANRAKIDDLAYTLACRREHLAHRAFAVIQGTTVDSKAGLCLGSSSIPQLAMIFTGQGAQWPRMGIELLKSNATFSSSIKVMDHELKNLASPPDWSIQEELERCTDTSNLEQAAISQPLCTAIQVALVDTLADLAIRPHSVLGHSSGEIAAAYAAGRLSRRTAIVVAYYRGVLSQAATTGGAMAAIGLSWNEVAGYLQQGTVIACNNSPSNVTISGDEVAVRSVVEAIQDRNPGVFVKMLKVSTAYHSHHMHSIGEEYEGLIRSLLETDDPDKESLSQIHFYSSVTGDYLPASEPIAPHYFRRNLESPVLFKQAFDSLLAKYKDGPNLILFILEIGPHSALSGPIRQIMAQNSLSYPYASCIHRHENSNKTFLTALGTLWQHGMMFDLNQLTNSSRTAKPLAELPLYPWDHDVPHLFQNRIVHAWRYPKFPRHELLGSLVLENSEEQPSFRNIIQLEHVPWLRDHNVHGDVVLPCAAYVAMAGEAIRRLHSSDKSDELLGFTVKNMNIGTAMILEENKPMEVITSLKRWRVTDTLDSNGWEFTISSLSGTSWTKHCSGYVEIITSRLSSPPTTKNTLPRKTNAAKWYQSMWHVGARYGPSFQGLKEIECSTKEKTASAIVSDNTPKDCESRYMVHPTTIDIFFQVMAVAAWNGKGHAIRHMSVPTFIEQMDVYDCPGDLQVHASAKFLAHGRIHAWGYAVDEEGSLAMRLKTAKVTPLHTASEPDPHAGALTTWNLDPNFTKMSILVEQSAETAIYVPIMQEFTLLQIGKALERIQGMELATDTARKFVAWMKRQPTSMTHHSIDIISSEARRGNMPLLAHAIEKVAENITKLVTNEISPLEILMADDLLSKIYGEFKFTDRAPYFKLLGHQKPNMRILEIGAGTGGTTREILTSLTNSSDGGKLWSSYTYTDISAGFFGAAKERFKTYPALEFKTLDITKDPITQGFEPHSYDLIIATNVIHAVPYLQQALRYVHTLLRTDGTFYLEELCCEAKSINFVMGLLPGWWLGEDDDRVEEPYVQPDRWDRELRAAGFDGLSDCMLDAPRPNQVHAYMIARPVVQENFLKPIALLFDESTEQMAKDLEIELSQNGCFVAVLQHWDMEKELPNGDLICLLDISKPFFMDIDVARFQKFRDLLTRVSVSGDGILWLTRTCQLKCEHPRWGQTPGALRTIRKEMEIDIAICEIDRLDSQSWKAVENVALQFSRRHARSKDTELEYSIECGKIYLPRIYPLCVDSELRKPTLCSSDTTDVALNLTLGMVGRLDTLQWSRCTYQDPGDGEIAIEIMATGLNFRDVLTAMDLLEVPRQVLGLEAAGVVKALGSGVVDLQIGDHVLVMGGASLFATRALVPSVNCWRFPDSLTFREAASMPCIFLTVIHGLLEVGQMHSGQSILIHSACGGVGLAAIQICRMIGATIYCTVSTQEKLKFLEEDMKIPGDRIFDSRSNSFVADVLRATNGCGVDLVLNSLSGELLQSSWECVAEFGKMIEIGKRDLVANGRLSLSPFAENRSFHGIELAHLFERRPKECQRLLKKMIELYETGSIKPIFPIKTFQMAEAEQCFRYMQQGRHIGKVVLELQHPAIEQSHSSTLSIIEPKRQPRFSSNASYLLAGGFGGLGRILADWMVEHGARHLVFLSRHAGERETDKAFFEDLESQGCIVTTVKGSVAIAADVEKAICSASAPVRGVMNMSMQLQDMGFNQMTHSAWMAANEPKLNGTWNLHNVCLSREITLEFFFLFSSISGLFGNTGQANYAAANTFLDAFVQYRHSLGLSASAINIGLMYDHGYVADNPLLLERTRLQGMFGIRVPQLLEAITLVLSTPVTKSVEGTLRTCRSVMGIGIRSRTSIHDVSNRVMWKHDRRMAYYSNLETSFHTSSAGGSGEDTPSRAIKDFMNQVLAEPALLNQPDAANFLARQIAKKVAIMLLRPIDDENDDAIDISSSLIVAGLDSLVAIEMRSWWRTTFGFEITILQMLAAENMISLGERAVEGLKMKYREIEKNPDS